MFLVKIIFNVCRPGSIKYQFTISLKSNKNVKREDIEEAFVQAQVPIEGGSYIPYLGVVPPGETLKASGVYITCFYDFKLKYVAA